MRLGTLLFFPLVLAFAEPAYVGATMCAGCHRKIAAVQSRTNMALTWQGAAARALPDAYQSTKMEAGIEYHFARRDRRLTYSVTLPAERRLGTVAVETVVGGKRHGFSFLVRVPEIDGLKLDRAPLVETRYLHYVPSGQLVLSPGFPEEPPSTWESAIGRPLSPDFERKCLSCHGAPKTPRGETGVRCESCHGPGSEHLKAVASKATALAITNPANSPTKRN